MLSAHIDLEPAEDTLVLRAPPPAVATPERDEPCQAHPGVFQAALPGGKHVPILKTLLTTFCERNCNYCPFRLGRDIQRETARPDELADLFMQMQDNGIVRGLFLSSGISGGGIRSQDKLIDAVEIIRKKRRYSGYIHLKLLPGAERDQLLRSMQLADRVSINLEAPNQSRLDVLAPRKRFESELLQPLAWAEQIRQTVSPDGAWKGHWPTLATQFVVGAVGESDLELLATSAPLLQQLHLSRVYFSAFKPVERTPLEEQPPESSLRAFRLYQASFLLRDYGFHLEELPFEGNQLPRLVDPKKAWAEQNLKDLPLEVNKADRLQLMRLPGVGLKNAEKILQARLKNTLRTVNDLRRIGISPANLLPYVLLDGRRPAFQPALW